MRSARGLYRLSVALVALGAGSALAASAVALGRVRPTFGSVHVWLRDCDRFLLPYLTAGRFAVLALVLLGALTLARGVRSAGRQLRATRRLLRTVLVINERELASHQVRVLAGTSAQAFCVGLLRPRIYVSRVAIERLTMPELHAVIAHEAHHARRRDPLRVAALSVMADALFFIPGLAQLQRRYRDLAEVAADEAAITAVGSTATLAAALLRFDDASVPGTVGVTAERVDHLLGTQPRWELPVSTIAGTLATAAALTAAAFLAGSAVPGRLSIGALAMQSCMITMVLAPTIALGALVIIGRRVLTAGPARR